MPATAKRPPVDLPPIRLDGDVERVTPYRFSRTEFQRDGQQFVGKVETTWDVPYQAEFAAWAHRAADMLARRAADDAAAETVRTMRPQLAAHGYRATLERELRRIADQTRAEAFAAWQPAMEASLLRLYGLEIDRLLAAERGTDG